MKESAELGIRHYGNTANNALYNHLILCHEAGLESRLPIETFGFAHPMSDPAWEMINFTPPGMRWVADPSWSIIPGAEALRDKFVTSRLGSSETRGSIGTHLPAQVKRLWPYQVLRDSLMSRPGRKPPSSAGSRVGGRSETGIYGRNLSVLYGFDFLRGGLSLPQDAPFVLVEHGTLRWAAHGPARDILVRRRYLEWVRRTEHLWVTNLDDATVRLADELAPGRWSALPHPFIPSTKESRRRWVSRRSEFRELTSSKNTVLLASSLNSSSSHNKGTDEAIRAFKELRRSGIDVGLVLIEWGPDIRKVSDQLENAGLRKFVTWLPPLPRTSLQAVINSVDVVWDQFGYEAFGALALRVLDVGTPLVSAQVSAVGTALIGSQVPWRTAFDSSSICARTIEVLQEMDAEGRPYVMDAERRLYSEWLQGYHAPEICGALQAERYLQGFSNAIEAAPDAWARLTQDEASS